MIWQQDLSWHLNSKCQFGPNDLQENENQRLEGFFGQLRLVQPHAVALTCVDPPAESACPPSFAEIAEKVVLENPHANEQALIGTLTESSTKVS